MRHTDWDEDGLSVWCDACEGRERCDDCWEVRWAEEDRVRAEALALYGRPPPGWREKPTAEDWAAWRAAK